MNPSTASGRLVKDILWSLIVKTEQDTCCKCGEPMKREDFSIEHVEPWLDSDDPIGKFFDLNNISFSHLSCNVADKRTGTRVRAGCPSHTAYGSGCRCEPCKDMWRQYKRDRYDPVERSDRFQRTGY